MTWVDLVLNFSKLINNCFKSEEEKLIWLRKNGWDVGVNDGIVWCRHPSIQEDIMTVSGAIVSQSGFFVNDLIEVSELPIKEEHGIERGLII